ncbi:AAA family ATPase [Microbacterium sp. CFH 90308]|uniref:AAA family ATPase n=1 Tax=Microbacterium salsuginis TaxID=2722803 RepID=A0ABX1K8V9_9MICO|nr:LuxR family transcriptional regulator [Microbacterium sp. CFH 90308]NLP82788.1 AAA family ATPase [Microbacterium sp. CFH 90308]
MLVGRRAEQQAIDQVLAGARLGTSGVLAVTGEAGVGKTALLDAAVDHAPATRVLRATGIESEREIPFAMLLQLLRPALGVLDAIPSVQADALAAALALPGRAAGALPTGRDRFTIGAAVLSLICRYAEDGPVAVVVDDLHLADTPSSDALLFAARRLAADPVVVLVGVRSPDGDELVAGVRTLRVTGLDLEAARVLIGRATGRQESDAHVRLLHRATAGNPLALLELGSSDRDLVESLESGLPLRVPPALVTAFGRRLERVGTPCRAALLVAAVCGGGIRLVTDACQILGIDVSHLGEAEDEGLVTLSRERVEFRHPLVRSAVYSSASAQERRAAHRAAADATPATDVDRRAWHLSEAVWHADEGVAALLAQAGDHAVARAAYSVAAGAFERSASLTSDAQVRRVRLLRAADAAWTAGDGARALALLDQRGAVGSSPLNDGDVREIELRASIAARSGSLREALELLVAAADHAPSTDAEALALADAVHATYYLGDAGTAASLADRIDALQPRIVGSRAQALGLMATGMARTLAGFGGAAEIRAAVPLLEADPGLRHDPSRLSWLLLAPLFLRDSTGGAHLRGLVEEVRGAAGVGALPAVLFHVARDQSTTGASWARAEANYAEAIRLAIETGQQTELAMSLAGAAWLDSRAGRAAECRAHAAEARALCVARDIHVGEVWVAHAVGDLELSLGNTRAAVDHLSGLVALLARLGLDDVDLSPAPELVDALLRMNRRPDAAAAAADYHERAARKGQPWALARADRARGLVAESDFDAVFRSALESHEATLDRFETARTHLAFGSRLRRAGRRVDARAQLREALDSFDELGAVVWRDEAAAELRATGEHVRAAGASVLDALTPQELQVSLLLAEGRTTREAAAALFLSPKTVEYHLRKVYTKLGISSRSELADALGPTDRAQRGDLGRA